MRVAVGVLTLVVCAVPAASLLSAAAEAPQLVLADVTHALDDATLVITGVVQNRGSRPVGRLVVDATGFSPAGELITFGADGIPWEVRAGGAERFAVRLLVPARLVRDYVVQVSTTALPSRPLAGVRRTVSLELYHRFVLTRVRLDGDVSGGVLTIRSRVAGLPVERVTAEATVLIVQPKFNHLEHLTLDVPADAAVTVIVGGRQAFLVSLRPVDILLSTAWE